MYVPLAISDTIHVAFRAKLWRMDKLFHKLGGKKRKNQLERWTNGEESEWNFTVSSTEVTAQLLRKR